MSSPHDLPYDARIINLLTHERYSLAEVIARHARASGIPLEEADTYIKKLIDNPISNLRVESVDETVYFEESLDIDSERAQVAAQTLLATTTMLNSNVPSNPMQERLRLLAAAAVEELEQFYFGDAEDAHEGHAHQEHARHEHDHHEHGHHDHDHRGHMRNDN